MSYSTHKLNSPKPTYTLDNLPTLTRAQHALLVKFASNAPLMARDLYFDPVLRALVNVWTVTIHDGTQLPREEVRDLTEAGWALLANPRIKDDA